MQKNKTNKQINKRTLKQVNNTKIEISINHSFKLVARNLIRLLLVCLINVTVKHKLNVNESYTRFFRSLRYVAVDFGGAATL